MQPEELQKDVTETRIKMGKLETKLCDVHDDVKEIKKELSNHITVMVRKFEVYKESVDLRFDKNKTWLVAILVSLVFTLLGTIGSLVILILK